MTNKTIHNTDRKTGSLSPVLHHQATEDKYSTLILTSPSDIGVRRNKGRNGARYAPEAILAVLNKLNNHLFDSLPALIRQVSSNQEEIKDFHQAQDNSSTKISKLLNTHHPKKLIHIGGGHDHAYPLLKAINTQDNIEKILIINIDAHCDTRIEEDGSRHSGTPFRDYSKIADKEVYLIQFGIHQFANSDSTLSELDNIEAKHRTAHEIFNSKHSIHDQVKSLLDSVPFDIDDKTCIFFSLDCDAIDGSAMEGVSAVNGLGLSAHQVSKALDVCTSETWLHHCPLVCFGIYEYNPVFDNLSQKGSRLLASLIYDFLK